MTLPSISIRGLALLSLWAAAPNLQGASVQTLSNPVPTGLIQIDGDASDWLSVAQYDPDTVGDGSSGPARPLDIDILGGAIAHNEDYIYVLWKNAGENMVDPFSNWVFFDLDQDSATGGRNAVPDFAQIAIGYEFNLGGTVGWNAFDPAGTFVGGASGNTVAAGSDFIEWRIDRSVVQPNNLTVNPIGGTEFNVHFVAEDTVGDFYPNNAGVDWFTYDSAGVYDPGVPGDADGVGGVTIADYELIQANSFTRVLVGQAGDVDDNGFVDFRDFHEWKANFPGGAAAAEAAITSLGVPEPGAAVLSVYALGMLLFSRIGRETRR